MAYKGRLLLKWITFSDYKCGQYLFRQCLILPKYHLLTPFQWLKSRMQSLGDVKGVPYFFVEGIWKRYLSRGKLYRSSPYETFLTTPYPLPTPWAAMPCVLNFDFFFLKKTLLFKTIQQRPFIWTNVFYFNLFKVNNTGFGRQRTSSSHWRESCISIQKCLNLMLQGLVQK